jgi:glyoxylase-like metal-dependent hydrolase (beta-lactamase superfamily II)
MPTLSQLAPGVRRLLAPNPSMMTGPGTNTSLFGSDEIAVLDPGPLIVSHLRAIETIADAPIRRVLVTHTHPDHSPGAVDLARATGAQLLGRPAPEGQHQDATFVPDRVLDDGERVLIDGIEIEAVSTPGHASNHLCFRLVELNWICTGDHVIDGSTVVIDPPDGNMKHYLQSLQKLKALRPTALLPGHGEVINEPDAIIDWIVKHRLEREEKVVAALDENPDVPTSELVPHVYTDVDEKLFGWAERSLLAHLLKLEDEGKAGCVAGNWRLIAEAPITS